MPSETTTTEKAADRIPSAMPASTTVAGPVLRLAGDLLHDLVVVAGEPLRDLADQPTDDEADHDGDDETPRVLHAVGVAEQHRRQDHRSHHRQSHRDVGAPVERRRQAAGARLTKNEPMIDATMPSAAIMSG